jgi:hypothetical protein
MSTSVASHVVYLHIQGCLLVYLSTSVTKGFHREKWEGRCCIDICARYRIRVVMKPSGSSKICTPTIAYNPQWTLDWATGHGAIVTAVSRFLRGCSPTFAAEVGGECEGPAERSGQAGASLDHGIAEPRPDRAPIPWPEMHQLIVDTALDGAKVSVDMLRT